MRPLHAEVVRIDPHPVRTTTPSTCVCASRAEATLPIPSDAPALFLLVDAIPYDLAREVWAAGGMPGFAEPRPTVSVFPSLTDVAVHALLREIFPERPPG